MTMEAMEDRVQQWWIRAPIGEVVVYHEGLLMLDRLRKKSTDIKAKAFLDLAEHGVVQLFQQRISTDRHRCRYLARKVKNP